MTRKNQKSNYALDKVKMKKRKCISIKAKSSSKMLNIIHRNSKTKSHVDQK